jgi:hypothetical protein
MAFIVLTSTILLALVGLLNGLREQITFHYRDSLPHKLGWSRQFWDPDKSWRNKYVDGNPMKGRVKLTLLGWRTPINYPVQITDAYHLIKTLEIIAYSVAAAVPVGYIVQLGQPWQVIAAATLLFGTLRNLAFNVFYSSD